MQFPDVLSGTCADDLHEWCSGHVALAPCVCTCHDRSHEEAHPMTTIPAGAKRPTDRRKATATALTATAGEREWTVPTDALDDFELLDDLDEIENGNAARLPRALKRLLGEQYKDALDAIRDQDTGKVSVEAGAEFISELFGSLPQGN